MSKRGGIMLEMNQKNKSEKKVYYEYLTSHISTNSMVTKAIGIEQKNLTRYKAQLEASGRLWVVKNDYCKSTGWLADYLTTNEHYKPISNQLNLF